MSTLVTIIWGGTMLLLLSHGLHYFAIGITVVLCIIALTGTIKKEEYAATRIRCAYTGFVVCLFMGILSVKDFDLEHLVHALIVPSLLSIPFLFLDKDVHFYLLGYRVCPTLPKFSFYDTSGGQSDIFAELFVKLVSFILQVSIFLILSLLLSFVSVTLVFTSALYELTATGISFSFLKDIKSDSSSSPPPDKPLKTSPESAVSSAKQNKTETDGQIADFTLIEPVSLDPEPDDETVEPSASSGPGAAQETQEVKEDALRWL